MGIAYTKFLPALIAGALVGGCSTTHEFRVASVGEDGAVEFASEPSEGIIVASAGNVPLLPAYGYGIGVPPSAPGSAPPTSAPFIPAGAPAPSAPPPLVEPGLVPSPPSNGTGAVIGEFVSIDLSGGQVTAGVGSLANVGVQVGGQGNLLGVDVAANIPGIGGTSLVTAIRNPLPVPISTIAAPLLSPVNAIGRTAGSALQPATSAVNQTVNAATGNAVTLPGISVLGIPLCC